MIRIMRLWRSLVAEKRSGQALGISNRPEVSHRRSGELTVLCPACPEPGFNVDEDTISKAAEEES